MEIKGIQGDFQVSKIKPGYKLEDVKKATNDNDLQEIVIKNESGLHVIVSKDLEVAPEYLDKDGLSHQTNITNRGQFPSVGDQMNFGDLKGEVVYTDNEGTSDSNGFAIGAGPGALIGFVGGTIGGALLSEGGGAFGVPGFLMVAAMGTGAGIALGGSIGKAIANHFKPTHPDSSQLAKIADIEK
jgi:hypothetical protein